MSLSDGQIRNGWVFITARQNATPLFFSRPAGRTPDNYWGNNVMGARGNDEFMHPEVKAVNLFRRQMNGQPEDLQTSESGSVILVSRGTKGAAIINIGDFASFVDLPTTLPSGTYRDKVYNREFKVKNGRLKGMVAPNRSYIITK